MKRSKKIVLIAHCLLNVNSKIYGLAQCSAGTEGLISSLMQCGYGIIQLPCVEQAMGGVRRWGAVKEQLDFPEFQEKCRELLKPIINQIEDFSRNGYTISGVIGVDGSPTCGVFKTCSGEWYGEIGEEYGIVEKSKTVRMVDGSGVMIHVLQELLNSREIWVPFFAIDETAFTEDYEKLLEQLNTVQ